MIERTAYKQMLHSISLRPVTLTTGARQVGKTVKSWVSVLIAGDIIHLLQPYSDSSTSKRITKRPKMYFWDTGLACYLARILDADSLIAGYMKGPMTET